MKTYNFFDLMDLRKFIGFISWDYKNDLKSLTDLEKRKDDVETQNVLTNTIISFKQEDLTNLKNDIYRQIKSKNETIENLKREVIILEQIKEKIKDTQDFKSAFEIISKS